jgi:Cd2+/Zn2+-exporting ATPase
MQNCILYMVTRRVIDRLRPRYKIRGMAHDHAHDHEHEHGWRPLAIQSAICATLGLAALALQEARQPEAGSAMALVVLLLALGASVAGGWEAAEEGWHSLRHHRRVDVHLLMLLAAAGAWWMGEWPEGVLLLFLFSAAGAMEHYAMDRTRRAVDALMAGAPTHARREDGTLVPVSGLRQGDRILLLPGDRVPADAELMEGATDVDESTLTGESVPVPKRRGSELLAGTLNGPGRVIGRVIRPEAQSAVQRILNLIREAQSRKAPSQRLIDKWGGIYAAGVIVAAGVFLLWLRFAEGVEWQAADGADPTAGAIYRAMTLLVVMSPCALVLSIPSAVLAAIAAGARRGILFRGGAAVERLAEVRVMCFDKTGTLTRGEPEVTGHTCAPADDAPRALRALAALAAASAHPLSRSVAAWCRGQGVDPTVPGDFESVTGEGVQGVVEGALWRMGKRTFVGAPDPGPSREEGLGSEVWVSDGRTHLLVRLRDTVRTESRPVLAGLGERGVHCVMLTGDKSGAAAKAAAEIGVPEVASGLKPWDKVERVRAFSSQGKVVAMVGDGVNDAPSLAAADVSVAMAGRGSDAAKESSDILLVDDRLDKLLEAFDLSLRTRRVIRQNLLISLGTVTVMALLTVVEGVPLYLGVIAHEGSTVLVCLNGLRLLARRR